MSVGTEFAGDLTAVGETSEANARCCGGISEVIDQGIEVVVEVNSVSASAEAWEIGKFGSQENFHSRETPHFVEKGVSIIFGENDGTFACGQTIIGKNLHTAQLTVVIPAISGEIYGRGSGVGDLKPITIGSGVGVAAAGHDFGNYDLTGGRQGKESEKGDGILHLIV